MKLPEKHHIIGILGLVALMAFFIGLFFKIKHENLISEKGIESVCFVNYKQYSKNGYRGYYYYYVGVRKYSSDYVVPSFLNPLDPLYKFYEVYYLKESPEVSIVDYSKEIHPDSVFKYFPNGKNPYESEIKQDSLRRVRGGN